MKKNVTNSQSRYERFYTQLFDKVSFMVFTNKDIRSIPNADVLERVSITHAVQSGFIKRLRRNQYQFSEKLVFNDTKQMAKELRSVAANYNKKKMKLREKNKQKIHSNLFHGTLDHTSAPIENISDEFMINLLKSKGYKVLKPTTTFEEL